MAIVILRRHDGYSFDDGNRILVDGIAVLTKLSLIAAGIFLVQRSRAAWFAILGVLVLSTIHSLAISLWFMPSVSPQLSTAGQAGRVFGRVIGLVLPLLFYIGVMIYLCTSNARKEFVSSVSVTGDAA